jgi:hypothetical protein
MLLYFVDSETTQWPYDQGQKEKQRSTKHTHKTKDRETRTQNFQKKIVSLNL